MHPAWRAESKKSEHQMSKPKCLKVQPDRIPPELASRPQWVPWSLRKKGQKWEKVPVGVTGRPISITDPRNLMTLEAALAAGKDGVGFVFTEEDPFAGIDLDRCRDPLTGEIEGWAQRIIAEFDTYVEVSPSGTGVKLFVEGQPPVPGSRKGKIEIYSRDRYFTVTGYALQGSRSRVEARQAQLGRIHAEHIGNAQGAPQAAWAGPNPMTDDEIVERIIHDPKYGRLWEGDAAGYGSQSEGDLALCGHLAFYVGPDPDRMKRILKACPRTRRAKWRRDDYVDRTIERAIRGQERFYDPDWSPWLNQRDQVYSVIQVDTRQEINTPEPPPGGVGSTRGPVGTEYEKDAPAGASGGQGGGQGVLLALGLVDMIGREPDWRAAFVLARTLMTISKASPEPFRDAVYAFAERAGRPAEDLWYAVLDVWSKIELAEGEDVLGLAVARAEAEPLPHHPNRGPDYDRVVSIAYHLASATSPAPFFLPVPRLAKLLGKSSTTAAKILNVIQSDGVIRCVKADYSFKEGKAREFEFVGPPMSGEGRRTA